MGELMVRRKRARERERIARGRRRLDCETNKAVAGVLKWKFSVAA